MNLIYVIRTLARNAKTRVLASKTVPLTTRQTQYRYHRDGGRGAAAVCLSQAPAPSCLGSVFQQCWQFLGAVVISAHWPTAVLLKVSPEGHLLTLCFSCFPIYLSFFPFYFNRLESKVWKARTSKGKSVTFLSGSQKPERLPVCWQICKELNLSTFI